MKIIWSFWTKPFNGQHGSIWKSTKHYLLSWVLSVETAKKHYSDTLLYTDDEGADILVNRIGLEFSHVSTDLNVLDVYNAEWLSLGKLFAYKSQLTPFVHLDNDVFLWKPFPREIVSAPILAQNPEYFSTGATDCYLLDEFEAVVTSDGRGWLPEEWKWYRHVLGTAQKAVCCGIFGGNCLDFIKYYANLAITVLDHPLNQPQMADLQKKRTHMILLEQYLLSACVDYHRYKKGSPFKNTQLQYLFPSLASARDNAALIGFTHLIGNSKSNTFVANRLEERVKKDYPRYYERCVNYASKLNISRPGDL